MNDVQKPAGPFTRQGAWLGAIAYGVVILIIAFVLGRSY